MATHEPDSAPEDRQTSEAPAHDRADLGGETACWAHLVDEETGAVGSPGSVSSEPSEPGEPRQG